MATKVRGALKQVGSWASAAIGVISGLAPHIMHHVGFLGGAVLGGTLGVLVFGALGLILSIPFLYKIYKRFGTWVAPGIAVAVFTLAFVGSTIFIGPAVQSQLQAGNDPVSHDGTEQPMDPQEHDAHH